MTAKAGDRLVVGGMFRVRYRLDNQRRDRVMVAKYLGWSRFYTQHDFDLRPAAGTTSLSGDAIIDVELVPGNTAPQIPVMA